MDIKSLLGRHWNVEVVHILKEANQCANMMAKFGVDQLGSIRSWLSPPADMLQLLVSDTEGVVYVCF